MRGIDSWLMLMRAVSAPLPGHLFCNQIVPHSIGVISYYSMKSRDYRTKKDPIINMRTLPVREIAAVNLKIHRFFEKTKNNELFCQV